MDVLVRHVLAWACVKQRGDLIAPRPGFEWHWSKNEPWGLPGSKGNCTNHTLIMAL